MYLIAVSYKFKISIHAPAKGATAPITTMCYVTSISIHAPAKGATAASGFFRISMIFQSTLPRRERLSRTDCTTLCSSTFQSTLPRRERRSRCRHLRTARSNFNPRSREGSDRAEHEEFRRRLISIHAPAKGATLHFWTKRAISRFQSTLPRRERLISVSDSMIKQRFQSTLPRRERRKQAVRDDTTYRFQSTLPRRERRW